MAEVAICRQIFCHIEFIYGQLKLPPLNNISLMRVSMGVLPTSLTKNNCSMTCELTVRREGNLSNNLPNLIGWFGYCVLQYSSRAHWDFSCSDSIWPTSDRPQASETEIVNYVKCCMLHTYNIWGLILISAI